MIKKWMVPVLIAAVLLAACAPAAASLPLSREESKAVDGGAMPEAPMPAPMAAPMEGESYAADQAVASNGPAEPAGKRIVIMNADMTIVVPDPAGSMKDITAMTSGMGGFVVTSNLYKIRTENGLDVPEATITVRVPAERMNEAIDKIKAMVKDAANDILSENVSGSDVTREYTDLQSRLTNLEQTAARLKEVLQSATKVEDILAVNSQLMQITEQIEIIKGQIKYYDETSSMSAISVRLQSPEAIEPLTIGGWKPVGVARNALQALIDMLKFLTSMLIWLVIFFVPLGILVFIPLRIAWALYRRWSKKRKANQAPPPPAQ